MFVPSRILPSRLSIFAPQRSYSDFCVVVNSDDFHSVRISRPGKVSVLVTRLLALIRFITELSTLFAATCNSFGSPPFSALVLYSANSLSTFCAYSVEEIRTCLQLSRMIAATNWTAARKFRASLS